MSDYTKNKPVDSGNYPQNVTKLSGEGAAGFSRVEPYMTPDRLRNEYLFGIPLYSPLTRQTMTNDTLKNIIRRATGFIETKCKLDLFPVQRFVRRDFDRVKYQNFNQIDLGFPNIQSIQEVTVRTSNSITYPSQYVNEGMEEGNILYTMPLEWIDLGYAHKGLIHFVPLQTTFSGTGIVNSGYAAAGPSIAWTAILGKIPTIPSFWAIKFTCGFSENSFPIIINELIGLIATRDVLSMLAPTNRYNSQSIGIDGASQSVGTAGVQMYALRIQELNAVIEDKLDLIKARYGQKIFMTHM